MSVTNGTCRVQTVGSGAGSQTIAVGFPFINSACLVVKTQTAGVEATLTLSTDYTVSQTFDSTGAPTGGTVSLLHTYAATVGITVLRVTPATQQTVLANGGSFDGPTVTAAFDKNTMLVGEEQDGIARALRLPDTDPATVCVLPTAASRANKILSFDASGNPAVVTTVPVGSLTVSTLGSALMNVANTAAAQAAIGVGTAGLLAAATDGTLAADSDANVPTQKAVKTYVDTNALNIVGGAQNVTGVKTFASSPIVPLTPTTSTQAASKGYVDSAVSAVGMTGSVVQSVLQRNTAVVTSTKSLALSDTPTASSGDQVVSATITPSSAASSLLIEVEIQVSGPGSSIIVGMLIQSGVTNALAAGVANTGTALTTLTFSFKMTAGSTYALTFGAYFASTTNGYTIHANSDSSGGAMLNGTVGSTIRITELHV